MAKSNSFEFDPARLPEVVFESEWNLGDDMSTRIYRVGNWSFEESEEDARWAEDGIYAFIAWWQFLKEKHGTEA